MIPSLSMRRQAGSLGLAMILLWFTLLWNTAEGIIAVTTGIMAGSVALIGFGLDSSIEVAAAGILIWRLQVANDDRRAEGRETLARRVVGGTFIVLAGYILIETVYVLVTGNEPEVSRGGLLLALAATIVMPGLALTKRWNAQSLGSPALIAESTESLFCSYLSLTLFIGLAANAAFGWWWADIAAALAMVPWIVKEGREGLRGEACGDACAE